MKRSAMTTNPRIMVLFLLNPPVEELREAAKKVIFLVDNPLKGGGKGVRGCPLRKRKKM